LKISQCLFKLPSIILKRSCLFFNKMPGRVDPGLMARLERRLHEVEGRGACRHPDGAVNLVRSALHVFAADVATHAHGAPCVSWDRPTLLRFPPPARAA